MNVLFILYVNSEQNETKYFLLFFLKFDVFFNNFLKFFIIRVLSNCLYFAQFKYYKLNSFASISLVLTEFKSIHFLFKKSKFEFKKREPSQDFSKELSITNSLGSFYLSCSDYKVYSAQSTIFLLMYLSCFVSDFSQVL